MNLSLLQIINARNIIEHDSELIEYDDTKQDLVVETSKKTKNKENHTIRDTTIVVSAGVFGYVLYLAFKKDDPTTNVTPNNDPNNNLQQEESIIPQKAVEEEGKDNLSYKDKNGQTIPINPAFNKYPEFIDIIKNHIEDYSGYHQLLIKFNIDKNDSTSKFLPLYLSYIDRINNIKKCIMTDYDAQTTNENVKTYLNKTYENMSVFTDEFYDLSLYALLANNFTNISNNKETFNEYKQQILENINNNKFQPDNYNILKSYTDDKIKYNDNGKGDYEKELNLETIDTIILGFEHIYKDELYKQIDYKKLYQEYHDIIN